MPKLKPEATDARRRAILDAALRCFRARGFHQTSVKEICQEGGFSPGALYLYFDSKEALIEGLVEAQIDEATALLGELRDRPNLLGLLEDILGAWLDETLIPGEMSLRAEILAESLRNERIRALLQRGGADTKAVFVDALRAAAARGEIAADLDVEATAAVLFALSDGLSLHLAFDPSFDPARIKDTVGGLMQRWLAATGVSPRPGQHLSRPALALVNNQSSTETAAASSLLSQSTPHQEGA
jgi:TetR/AcrR family transcriptional regulator, repressor for uid operon